MDKLRAIQYFNRSVEEGSLAAAARSFDVSTPAVTHLVSALERSLGVVLLHRTSQRISLTADGERYYEGSRRVAADLQELERNVAARGARPRGTLTIGMPHSLGQYCVMPRIAQFLAEYPELEALRASGRYDRQQRVPKPDWFGRTSGRISRFSAERRRAR